MTDNTFSGYGRPELRKAVEAFVDAGFAGLQMRVHDDRGVWAGSAGVREAGGLTPPPAHGHFWAGSVATTFTATLALQLVAEGRLGLDSPAAAHLPSLPLDERITLRMLLQHTSGLVDHTGEYCRPRELVELALAQPPRFQPGTGWSYSNTNYTLAALLIEQTGGGSYGEQMQRRILGPLGLRNTVLAGDVTDLPEPYAHGHYRQNLSMLLGAGGAISTTRDLHLFFSALNSGKLLPAPLLAEMRTPSEPTGYGLGVLVQDLGPAGVVYHHNGGAPGGYGALMYSTPDGRKTMTAGLTMGDAALEPSEIFPQALDTLVRTVFAGEGDSH
jgi:CubicO group peptidase (beta-lactamase class C family)